MKIVQLPRKVWIGSYEFPVRIVDADDPALKDEAGVASDGMMDNHEDHRAITISNKLDTRKRLEIVFHELVHAINIVNGITDDLPVEEDEIADKHGLAWSQFYLDNPRFAAWVVYTIARIRKDQKADDELATETNQTYVKVPDVNAQTE